MTLLLIVLFALGVALCVTGMRLMRSREQIREDLVPLATVWTTADSGRRLRS